MWVWASANGQRIVNLFTQEPPDTHHGTPGRASVHHVNHALRELRQLVETEELTSLALPRLATGVGGLDWAEVKPLLQKHLGDLPIPIYVYTSYRKGVQAEERS